MAYVPVKGGTRAIEASLALLAEDRRGDTAVPELSFDQIREQMSRAVDRVMAEGSLYDADLAALALKQAAGDATEAAFLIRAYRTAVEEFGRAVPLDTARMAVRRRISAAYKDLPGGQILGPSTDYTHRMLDFGLAAGGDPDPADRADAPVDEAMPRVPDIVAGEGFMEPALPPAGDPAPSDLTRTPLGFPADRDVRLQNLARGDEGFLLGLAYSTQRGYGANHPYAGEIRVGEVPLEVVPEELGVAIDIGDVTVTESQMITSFKAAPDGTRFTRGYGLVFGHAERKAMSMALVDRALRADEFQEERRYPAQDEEFVLFHSDNVESSGFVQHLKLPHYVDFQSELHMLREMRADAERKEAAE